MLAGAAGGVVLLGERSVTLQYIVLQMPSIKSTK